MYPQVRLTSFRVTHSRLTVGCGGSRQAGGSGKRELWTRLLLSRRFRQFLIGPQRVARELRWVVDRRGVCDEPEVHVVVVGGKRGVQPDGGRKRGDRVD